MSKLGKRSEKPFSKTALLKQIQACHGFEVPKEYWDLAEALVDDGKITLSGARGPGKWFKRAELVRGKLV